MHAEFSGAIFGPPSIIVLAGFVFRLLEHSDYALSSTGQGRRLRRRQYARAKQIVHLADEGIEVSNRAIVLSRVHHGYRVLQLTYQRVVLSSIDDSLRKERIHGVRNRLGRLLWCHDREAEGVRRLAARISHHDIEAAGQGDARRRNDRGELCGAYECRSESVAIEVDRRATHKVRAIHGQGESRPACDGARGRDAGNRGRGYAWRGEEPVEDSVCIRVSPRQLP